jgi:hypothetical protein
MKHLAYALDIDSPPERVWEQLTDFEGFPDWNPFIRRASGKLAPGETLELTLELGGTERTFRPTLTRVVPNRELRWQVRIGVRGIFDVERIFQVEPVGNGRTRFAQSEICSGVLVPVLFLWGKLERDILRGYHELARAVKERVEPGAVAKGSESPQSDHV